MYLSVSLRLKKKRRKEDHAGGEKDGKVTRAEAIKKKDGGKGKSMMMLWSQTPKFQSRLDTR